MKSVIAATGVFVFLSLIGFPSGAGANTPVSVPGIELIVDRSNPDFGSIAFVIGKSAVVQARSLDQGQLKDVFPVWVGEDVSRPKVSGRYRTESDRILFTPRFAFEPGLRYTARIHRSVFVPPLGSDISVVVSIPGASPTPVAHVLSVQPGGTVPENLLRFYIVFSHPMRRGQVYRNIRLLDQSGAPIERAFLELEPELWDPGSTRLTLLFDPGRIKRGLKPRQDLGPALIEGNQYTLVIEQGMEDASARPLLDGYEHRFRVSAADRVSPNPGAWRVRVPEVGEGVLVMELDEPVDHALLQRMTRVVDSGGRLVAGEAFVAEDARRWSFAPDRPWKPGRYDVRVDVRLEDWAGNRIDGLFDQEMSDTEIGTPGGKDYVDVPFVIE